jgi:hypothetical protein
MKNRRFRCRLGLELLEDRTLPSAANIFAQFDGALANAAATDHVNINVLSTDFTLSASTVSLGFALSAGTGSSLDPAAIGVQAADGSTVTATYSQTDVNGSPQSVVLAPVSLGTYTLNITSLNNTSGAYHLDIFLPGDVAGTRNVTLADGLQIRSLFGTTSTDPAYLIEADANLDGQIDTFDYSQWRANYGDSTDINPLILTARPSATLTVLADGSYATNSSQFQLKGTARPGATVHLGTGTGTDYGAGTFTADSSGNFTGSVTLTSGLNTLRFRVQDAFGQKRDATLAVTLDTVAPTVTIASPASGQTFTTNVTVTGTTADVGTGVASLVAQVDGRAATPVTFAANGAFSFTTSLRVDGSQDGTHVVQLQATDRAGNVSAPASVTFTLNSHGQANAVIVWNQATLNAIQIDGTDPLMSPRALAMVQSAVFDAVNAVQGTRGYYVSIAAPTGSSVDAAVDAAAYNVLSYLYPAQKATFDALLATQIGLLPTGQGTTDGETVGMAAANAIIAMRANDGSRAFVDFEPSTAVGLWQPTAPAFAPALDPQGGNMTPWALTSTSQFRPAGPPALTSQAWADAVNQVKALGRVNSTTRTTDQTQIAQFWNDGIGTYTPSGHWNAIAQTVAQQQGKSLVDDARIFAELDIALADAGITAWNTKYNYDTWRPITVIQTGGAGVNSAVTADTTWQPLLTTPNFPEYISGHSTYSAAAATVLDSIFGTNVSFTTTEVTLNNVVRMYSSFDQAAQDAGISRIYGGIHFSFSNTDGQATGTSVANWDLATFSTTTTTTPPRVTLDTMLPSGASKTNVTITGHVTDYQSGVAKLEVQVDTGTYASLTFDARTGNFTYTTTFLLNGTADGRHTINFRATDNANNVSTPVPFTFVLATQAPTLTVTSPTNNGTLAAGALLTGTATAHGPALTMLNYAFDAGTKMPVAFNADGSFSQALDLSKLAAGAHTLVVTATDAAGNTASKTLTLSQPAAIPLMISGLTPANGSTDEGVTIRPSVVFTRPINTTTLTTDNFYATATTGAKVPATVVPSSDGTYAWLFFTNPLPGGSTITLTINGSTIKAADGSLLDAAGTGVAGSKLTTTFTTVSTVSVAGTTLSGILADPGDDLQPGTRDDVRVGPSGILGAADTVYLNPIAGAKIFIIGFPNQTVTTDAQGRFSFTSVPTGDVKLDIDGRTATNAPTGVYYPDMVMDLTIKPGVANTVMGSMGTTDQEAANANNLGVYLPRVQKSILQTVSATQPTTVGLNAGSGLNLTPEQASQLKLTVMPGTGIGMDGQKMSSFQLGISVVPPSIVMDMLPTGVLQHTFDITIQALGVATFTTPAQITFPNVYNAAPGTQMNFLSFDHTTGRLEIDGTATVSADGLSVTTDPGMGITHPGWHGLPPPGGCGKSGGPPPAPPPPPKPTDTTKTEDPIVQLYSGHGEDGEFALTWDAPNRDPSDPPPGPPNPKCPTPPRPPTTKKDKTLTVQIDVDGPLSDFTHRGTNSLPLSGATFTLVAGSGERKKFEAIWKDVDDMFKTLFFFGGGLKSLDHNVLFGSKITVTTTTVDGDGNKMTDIQPYYLYRFIDATDDTPTDGSISFADTLTNSGVTRTNKLELMTGPDSQPTVTLSSSSTNANDFSVTQAGSTVTMNFSPVDQLVGPSAPPGNDMAQLNIAPPQGNSVTVGLQGKSFASDNISLDSTAITNAIIASGYGTPASDATIATQVIGNVTSLFAGNPGITVNGAGVGNTISVSTPNTKPTLTVGGVTYLVTGQDPDIDNIGKIGAIVANQGQYNSQQQAYILAEALNQATAPKTVQLFIANILANGAVTAAQAANKIADTIAHEVGHALGLVHTYSIIGGRTVGGQAMMDIMAQGVDFANGGFSFGVTGPALKMSLKETWAPADAQSALSYYTANYTAAGGSFFDVDGIESPPSDVDSSPLPGPHLAAFNTQTGVLLGRSFDFGTLPVDSTGNTPTTASFTLANYGSVNVTVNSVGITSGSSEFTVGGVTPGTVLSPGSTLQFQVSFEPSATGNAAADLHIVSSDPNSPFDINLTGFAQSATPSASLLVSNNNMGGAPVGSSAASAKVATITNQGAQPLVISAILVEAGGSSFTLTGVPANLATNPITLAPGQTFTFGVKYTASKVGLERAKINVSTNDPANPVLRFGVDGTGLANVVSAHWGKNYVAIEFPNQPSSLVLRAVSDDAGDFDFFMPANQAYHLAVFDPMTGLIAHGYGTTAASGGATDLTYDLVFRASTAKDTNGDGLPDDIKFATGASFTKSDTSGSGIDDFTKLKEGLSLFGGQNIPTGVIASLALQGGAQAVTLQGSPNDLQGQTAYVTTGSYGLAIVNASQFQKPVLLGQIQLTGNSTSVDVDPNLRIAAVASNAGGLNFIDVSNPVQPKLLHKINVNATQVKVIDGFAYAAVGGDVISYDLLTGEQYQDLVVSANPITGLAADGSFLYTMDTHFALHVVDVSGSFMANRGSLTLANGGGQVSVGNGIAYVAATNLNSGGFSTVNVSDPNNPSLIAGPSQPTVGKPGTAIVANGSGLGLAIGQLNFVFGGFTAVDVVSLANPSNTYNFITRYNLPAGPLGVAIGEGIGFVADGTAGLQVVNYQSFDTLGVPPTANVSLPPAAIVGTLNGMPEVVEGSNVPLIVNVSDDVQVRNVELLVNGQVTQNAVSFPFGLTAVLPTLAQNGSSTITLQVRATDTGGDVGLSNTITVVLVRDTVAPTLIHSNVTNNATVYNQLFRAVILDFSKPLDQTTVTAATFQLTGPGSQVIAPTTIDFRRGGATVELKYPELAVGNYQFVVNAAAVTDRAGNALGTGNQTTNFQVKQYSATWVNANGGDWSNPANWLTGVVPGAGDDVLINVPGNVTITFSTGTTHIHSLHSTDAFTLSAGTLQVDTAVQVDNNFTINGGTLKSAEVVKGSNGQGVNVASYFGNPTWDGVTLDADLDFSNAQYTNLTIVNGLTLAGSTIRLSGYNNGMTFSGDQALTGTGAVQLIGTLAHLNAANASTLTIGSTITVTGAGSIGGQAVVNMGTVNANTNGSTLAINPATFTNGGIVEATKGGILALTGLTGNLGTVTLADANSQASVTGTNYVVNSPITATNGETLSLLGTWTASIGVGVSVLNATLGLGSTTSVAALSLTNSTLDVLAAYTVAQLNPLLPGNALMIGPGGSVDNTGNTLSFAKNVTLAGGTLKGGTLTATGGAKIIVSSAGGTLDGVILNGNLDLTASGSAATVLNGLTLNGTATLGNSGNSSSSSLTFSGTQTLAGTGSVVFATGGAQDRIFLSSSAGLTVGSGIAIHGGNAVLGFGAGTLVNQGNIAADVADAPFTINPISFDNQGGLQISNGGRLFVSGLTGNLGTATFSGSGSSMFVNGSNYTVNSSISAGSGETLSLLGTWTAAAGVNITVTGGTLVLGNTTSAAALSVNNSTVEIMGTYTTAQLLAFGSGNTLQIGPGGVLDNTNNTLALNGSSQSLTLLGGTLKGGTVSASSGAKVVVATTSGNTLDGVTLNSDLDLTASSAAATVLNGLTLNGTATFGNSTVYYTNAALTFSNTQTLGGTGSFSFNNTYYADALSVAAGTTLTIGSGITIHGGNVTIGSSGAVINNGTIAADVAGFTVTVNPNSFTNAGTLQASNGGILAVSGVTGNLGTATLSGTGSSLSVNGTNYTVNTGLSATSGETLLLLGSWTIGSGVTVSATGATLGLGTPGNSNLAWSNNGVVNVTNSTLKLGGKATNLGTLNITNSTIALVGTFTTAQVASLGTGNPIAVGVGGTVDNTSSTLTLNATTGSLTLAGGTLKGGTVNASGGAKVIVIGSNSTLDGVTLNSDLDLTASGANATILDGLTLNGIATLRGGTLFINTTETLGGTGSVVFATGDGTSELNIYYTGVTLTIGSGITVHGGNGIIGYYTYSGYGTVINNGTIAADVAGTSIAVNTASFTNAGTLKAANGGILSVTGLTGNLGTATLSGSGSSLSVSGTNYTLNTSLSAGTGQTLALLGTWTAAAGVTVTVSGATLGLGSTNSLAAVSGTNSLIVVQASYTGAQIAALAAGNQIEIGPGSTLDNTGNTLTLSGSTHSLLLAGGTLKGGTVAASGGAKVVVTGSNSTLDGVTLNSDLDLATSGASATVVNGLTLNGTATLKGGTLFFNTTETLGGTGSVVFATGDGANELNIYYTGVTLTIGAGITVHGGNGYIGYYTNSGYGSVVNNGTIDADLTGTAIAVGTASFANAGTLQATNGGRLSVTGLTGNLGTPTLSGSGSSLSVNGTNYAVNSSFTVGSGTSASLLGTWAVSSGVTINANSGATLALGTPGNPTLSWSNAGTITATGATINFGGSPSTLGAVNITNSTVELFTSLTGAQVQGFGSGNLVVIGQGGTLDNTGNTLTLTGSGNNVTLAGGTLKGGTVNASGGAKVVVTSAGGTLDGVTFNSDLDLTASNAAAAVVNGLTLNGTATLGSSNTFASLAFNNTETLGGTGSVVFASGGSTAEQLRVAAGATLTIGAAFTIHGGSGTIGTSTGTVVNNGTIAADLAGTSITVNPTSFTNAGTLKATGGGNLFISNLTGNLGATSLSGSGSLSVNGTYTVTSSLSAGTGQTLSLLGTWTAAAGVTITVTNASLFLGNTTSLAAVSATNSTIYIEGTYSAAQLQGLGSGNHVLIAQGGTLDNTNNTLTLTAATGSLLLAGGTLKGGTVNASGGAKIIVTGSASTLDGVTLNSDLDLTAPTAFATVVNGLTLNGTSTLGSQGTFNFSGLTFNGTQTLAGTGNILSVAGFNSNQLSVGANATLTIAAGITIHGAALTISSSAGSVVNNGTIAADVAGSSIILNPTAFTNAGTLQVSNGGRLSVSGLTGNLGAMSLSGTGSSLSVNGSNYTVNSSFAVGGSETVSLSGTFAVSAGVTLTANSGATLGLGTPGNASLSWSNAGTISATGATVNLGGTVTAQGTLTASNSTISLLASLTSAQVQGFGSGNQLVIGQGGQLDNSNSTLTLSGSTNSLTLAGGTLKGGTVNASGGAKVVAISAGGTLDGVTLNSDLDLTAANARANVLDGLTLNGTATLGNANVLASLAFNNTQTLGGSGTVVFASGNGNTEQLRVAAGATLTVGAGITIHGGSGIVGASSGTVVNNGTIAADVAGTAILVNPTAFTNAGTLQVSNGGQLSVSGLTGNLGTTTLTGSGSSLSLNGNYTINSSLSATTGQTLSLLGTWTAAAGVSITVSNATFALGNTTSLAALAVNNSTIDVAGSYTVAQIQGLGSGNRIIVIQGGTLDNTNNTLTLTAATGSLTLGGGTLKGGTVSASGGAKVIVTGSGSTLDGVTLNSDLDLTAPPAFATVVNGLTLNGTATLGRQGTFNSSGLTFNGTQTLAGTGNILSVGGSNSNQLLAGANATLTIAASITIHGAALTISASAGSVVNNGTINADTLGTAINLSAGSFTNAGTLEATSGGSLAVTGLTGNLGAATLTGTGSSLSVSGTNFTVSSSLSAGTGEALSLLGTWTAASGVTITVTNAVLNLGTTTSLAALSVTNSTVVVRGSYTTAQALGLFNGNRVQIGPGGVLDNTNNTLTLTAATGALTLAGGTLKNGTVSASGGAKVVVTGSGSTLDGVTLNSDLDLTASGASATVVDGLTLNGTATLGAANNASGSSLFFSTTETLGGSGSVVFAAGGAVSQLNVYFFNATLTIGAGITIHGGNGTVGYFNFSGYGAVVNNGTINADVAGAGISFTTASFTNAGTLEATNGGSLSVSGLTGNLGAAALSGTGSSITVNGTNYTVNSSFGVGGSETVSLLGSFSVSAGVTLTANSGATLGLGTPSNASQSWSNAGTISATGATINLGGSVTALGTLTASTSTIDLLTSVTGPQLSGFGSGNHVVIGQGGQVDNSNNTLTLTAATGSLTLAGGTLKGGTVNAGGGAKVVATSSGGTLDGVTLNSDLDVTVAGASATVVNGLTLNGTATLGSANAFANLNFTNTQTLGGNGSVVFASGAGTSQQLRVAAGATLTVGAGITIHGGSGTVGASSGTVVNNGTIAADVAGTSITVNPTSFTNAGTLKATGGGSLFISNLTGNLGATSLSGSGSGSLSVNGTYTVNTSLSAGTGQTLSLLGTWTAAAGATVTVSGGTFGLGNTTSLAAVSLSNSTLDVQGNYTYAQLQSLLSGNKLEIGLGGTLDNTNNTLTLSGSGQSLQLIGGTVKGGTVNASSGAKVVASSAGGTLDGVTLNSDLDLTASGANATVLDGLTLNGTATLGAAHNVSGSSLSFSMAETLGGTGSVVFATGGASSQLNVYYYLNATLTIGAGITVHGGNGTVGYFNSPGYGAVVNNGTINADVAGAGISFTTASFTNAGTLEATNGGRLSVSGLTGNLGTATLSGTGSSLSVNGSNYTVNSSLSAGSGQTLALLGTWTAATGVTITVSGGTFGLGTPSSLSAISLTNSTLDVQANYTYTQLQSLLSGNTLEIGTGGTLDNTGNTLTLNGSGQSLLLVGGTLKGGTVSASSGAKVIVTGSGSILDGVTLNSDLDLTASGASAAVVNGLTLNGTATLGAANNFSGDTLFFNTTETLGGTGTVRFATGGGTNELFIYYTGVTLTIGAGITIRGGNGTVGYDGLSGYGAVVNNGTINADVAGAGISFTTASFTNAGTLEATNGGRLSVTGLTGNLGTATLSGTGSSLSINGSGYTVNTSLSAGSGQTLALLGTWTAATGVTITVNSGTLGLGSTTSLAAVSATNSIIDLLAGYTTAQVVALLTGNQFEIGAGGTLDNTGNTLTLSGSGQSLLLAGGTFKGGTVSAGSGAKIIVTGFGSVLDGATLNSDLDLTAAGAAATVLHGLTLNGTASIGAATLADSTVAPSALNFVGTQTLGGNAIVLFGAKHTGVVLVGPSQNALTVSGGSTLTLASTVTVHGATGVIVSSNPNVNFTLLNQGTINADVNGGTITITAGTFINQGTLAAANGGNLTVATSLQNQGTLSAGVGSNIAVSGSLTESSGAVMSVAVGGTSAGQFGTISVGGTANLAGTLTATFVNGFTPVAGNTFQILIFGSRTGSFASVLGQGLPNGLTVTANYDPTDITLQVN